MVRTITSFVAPVPNRNRCHQSPSVFLSANEWASGQSLIFALEPPTKTFEPVLNVPALASFIFIAAIFSFLQLRVMAIEQAAIDRTEALNHLRTVKSKELAGTVRDDEVQRALQKYKEAVLKVEDLRTVIPGLARIVAPPSQSVTKERMDENVAAAKQFLGIDLEPKPEKEEKGMSFGLKILIGFVAAAQIGILILLSIDPLKDPLSSLH